MNYKVLTLWQPWALLLVGGEKKIETRPSFTNWTSEKGTYLIHAAKKMDDWQFELMKEWPFKTSLQNIFEKTGMITQFGAIIGSIEVTHCTPIYRTIEFLDSFTFNESMTIDRKEHALGDYSNGRYMWICENPKILKTPIPYKNGQGYYKNFKGDESQLIFL